VNSGVSLIYKGQH